MSNGARLFATVAGLRYWRQTLLAGGLLVVWRFLSGRDLRGGRTTDASFFRGAREQRRGWWASLPGVARAGLRLAPLALLWAWGEHPVLTGVAVVALLGWSVRCVVRRRGARRRERLMPAAALWPAVAGIIGVPAEEPASVWLDIPADMTADGAGIVVGLRWADSDDERRMRQLVTLFEQRIGVPFVGAVDYARRLVHIWPRPVEPAIWPAVASVLSIDPAELAEDWLEMPADPSKPGARIVVRLPDEVVDDEPVGADLKMLFAQRLGGEWSARKDRPSRRMTYTRKHPPAEPPKYVHFLTYKPEEVGRG